MTEPSAPDPSVYVLTPLTRGAVAQRRVVISGLDLPWLRTVLLSAAFVVSLPLIWTTWTLLSTWALLWAPTAMLSTYWLIETRTRTGLHLRRYQAMRDTRRATTDVFYFCDQPLDPDPDQLWTLSRSSVPAPRPPAPAAGGRAGQQPPQPGTGIHTDATPDLDRVDTAVLAAFPTPQRAAPRPARRRPIRAPAAKVRLLPLHPPSTTSGSA